MSVGWCARASSARETVLPRRVLFGRKKAFSLEIGGQKKHGILAVIEIREETVRRGEGDRRVFPMSLVAVLYIASGVPVLKRSANSLFFCITH